MEVKLFSQDFYIKFTVLPLCIQRNQDNTLSHCSELKWFNYPIW